MPLIINDTSIDYLNGPILFIFLTPPPTSRLNYNIILLGDRHDTQYYVPCNDTPDVLNCYDTIQFVDLLNTYALTERVDFYTEEMPTHSKLTSSIKTPIGSSMTKNIDILQFTARNYYNKKLSPKSLTKRNVGLTMNPEWSDMLNLYRNVQPCYYKDSYKHTESCLYKNIYWHFSNLRHLTKISIHDDIKHLLPMFENIKTHTLTIELIVEYFFEICEAYDYNYNKLMNLLNMYRDIISNHPKKFINELFTPGSPFYIHQLKKQFDKILPEMKDIITMESFYSLYNFYMNLQLSPTDDIIDPSINQENYKEIIFILTDLINIPKHIYDNILKYGNVKKLSQADQDYLTTLCVKLNTYTCHENLLNIIPLIALNSEIFLPDIYFIMRVFKKESDKFDSNKLIIDYMGANHNLGVQYYLTTFCGYTTNYQQDMEPGLRRISITKTINLNLLPLERRIVKKSLIKRRLTSKKAKSLSPFTRKIKTLNITSAPSRIGKGKHKKTKVKRKLY